MSFQIAVVIQKANNITAAEVETYIAQLLIDVPRGKGVL
jgi:hypothetical protein